MKKIILSAMAFVLSTAIFPIYAADENTSDNNSPTNFQLSAAQNEGKQVAAEERHEGMEHRKDERHMMREHREHERHEHREHHGHHGHHEGHRDHDRR